MPKIFIAHSHDDADEAASVAAALNNAGYDVFLDEDSLPPGGDYHARIYDALEQSDYFIFLISPDSVAEGAYTLTELEIAKAKWPGGADQVLPVIVRDTRQEDIPSYLRALTYLKPRGNLAGTVAFKVKQRFPQSRGLRTESAQPQRPGEKLDTQEGLSAALPKLNLLERLKDELPAYVKGINLSKQLSENCARIEVRLHRAARDPDRLEDSDFWMTLRDILDDASARARGLASALKDDEDLAAHAATVETTLATMVEDVGPMAIHLALDKCDTIMEGLGSSLGTMQASLPRIAEGSVEAADTRLRAMEKAIAELRTWLTVAEKVPEKVSQARSKMTRTIHRVGQAGHPGG